MYCHFKMNCNFKGCGITLNLLKIILYMSLKLSLIHVSCLYFPEFVVLQFFTKFRICELSILIISSDHYNNFCKILKFLIFFMLTKFVKIKTSHILPDLQYSDI